MIFAAKSREVFAVSFSKNSCYNIIFFSVVNDFFKCFSKNFSIRSRLFACSFHMRVRKGALARVYLLIHALNRFTKNYKIISDCSDWGIDTLF